MPEKAICFVAGKFFALHLIFVGEGFIPSQKPVNKLILFFKKSMFSPSAPP